MKKYHDKLKVKCFNCNRCGHFAADCYNNDNEDENANLIEK